MSLTLTQARTVQTLAAHAFENLRTNLAASSPSDDDRDLDVLFGVSVIAHEAPLVEQEAYSARQRLGNGFDLYVVKNRGRHNAKGYRVVADFRGKRSPVGHSVHSLAFGLDSLCRLERWAKACFLATVEADQATRAA